MSGPGVAATGEADHTKSAAAAEDREHGTVKWFNVSKGFGFIIREDGEEIFVHFRSIRGEGRRSLRDGQRVSFCVVQSEKGPQAEDVLDET
ncbi:MAG: cold shock domain-containing protein [Halioglobus sp.]|nr:cold shock domain-containing protein [Halioglobus sp.]